MLIPMDTGRKLNVHKTFRSRPEHALNTSYLFSLCPERKLNVYEAFGTRPGRLLNVLCTFNLRFVSRGSF